MERQRPPNQDEKVSRIFSTSKRFLTPVRSLSDAVPAARQQLTLESVERDHIVTVLQQTDWVVEGPRGAARILELHPNTLRNRMKKLGITRASHQIR
jgi:transcriptional regulator with GAF, ATPase, and Fis domain